MSNKMMKSIPSPPSSDNYLQYLHSIHQLIKNDDYDAREGDVCFGCGLLLHKKSAVYHCIHFSTGRRLEDDRAEEEEDDSAEEDGVEEIDDRAEEVEDDSTEDDGAEEEDGVEEIDYRAEEEDGVEEIDYRAEEEEDDSAEDDGAEEEDGVEEIDDHADQEEEDGRAEEGYRAEEDGVEEKDDRADQEEEEYDAREENDDLARKFLLPLLKDPRTRENDCANFFLHQSCAHLPRKIQHPSHRKHSLYLSIHPNDHLKRSRSKNCHNCGIKLECFYYFCIECPMEPAGWFEGKRREVHICLACVIPSKELDVYRPYHGHKLTLSKRLATFECDACQEVDTDFSYMCYTCPFWIHLSCSNLPTLLECKTRHKHSLRLAYSLPEIYRTFQQSCKICENFVYPLHWLYHCPNCRFFAHIKCAISPPTLRITEFDEKNILHLPMPEHESLLQKCINKQITPWSEDACMTPPDHIYHWSHEHQLVLKNTSASTTIDEKGILTICNGCTESISTNDNAFYECSECDYVLHQYCAMLPKEMQLDVGGQHIGNLPGVQNIWFCTRCECLRNGTQLQSTFEIPSRAAWLGQIINVKLDVGCAVLPKRIKHEAHSHLLELSDIYLVHPCSACNKSGVGVYNSSFKCMNRNGRNSCEFYNIHIKCALRPRKLTHRWDPHPLYLIFSPEEVADHPHEFSCELCSKEINTNLWFYHCSVCDLSFHNGECIDMFFRYSKVKFGATNIKIEDHQHDLTFVVNKKRGQPCRKCHFDTYCKAVLLCRPCKFIQHAHPDLCCDPLNDASTLFQSDSRYFQLAREISR